MKSVVDEFKDNGLSYRDEVKKNFDEAMKNECFSNLVSKLKISHDKLMKYTTTLEECSNNYYVCSKCKGLINCPFSIIGYSYLPHVVDSRLEFDYRPCKFMKKKILNDSFKKNIYTVGVSLDNLDAAIDKVYSKDSNRYEAILWVNTFLGNYRKGDVSKGLYLNGSFGSGKTYLISALFNELARDGVKSSIVFWPEFLRDLKAAFSSDFKEKYEFVKNSPLLLIDDIGAEATTQWGRDEIFCPLVQYRMQEGLPTFFTSNLDLKALEEHFALSKDKVDYIKARRIIERIVQLTDQIEMVSKNLRG